MITTTGRQRAATGAPDAHESLASPWSLRATGAPVGAPGTTRTCDLGICKRTLPMVLSDAGMYLRSNGITMQPLLNDSG